MNGRIKKSYRSFLLTINLIYYYAFISSIICGIGFIVVSCHRSWYAGPPWTYSGSSPPSCSSSLPCARGISGEETFRNFLLESLPRPSSNWFYASESTKRKKILKINQNKNNIKLYQATGTNRWDRPPLPQKYNEQGRNHVGTALDMRDKN